jgi:uncharacterized protein (UPF0335 family)
MTKKRFTVIDMEEPRKQSVAEKGIPCTARHCCTRLNRLTEENEQLKKENQEVKDILNELKSINGYWDSALLQEYIDKIANVLGVDLE